MKFDPIKTGEVIPFGKYKGQPLEVLQADRDYQDWLTTQGWLVEKYPQIHTLIVNNFQESSETPEHNALQIKFLDYDWAWEWATEGKFWMHPEHKPALSFEDYGFDVVFNGYLKKKDEYQMSFSEYQRIGIELKPSIGDDYPAIIRQMKTAQDRLSLTGKRSSWNNQPDRTWTYLRLGYLSYCGIGATEEQFVKLCAMSNIVAKKITP